MRKAFVELVDLPEPRFRDGLGIRYVRGGGGDDPAEVLRPLWDVGAMQNAIRQRVGRLQSFRQARFITLRSAEVPRDDPSTIEVVSDFVAGHRLSQYLDAAQAGAIPLSTNAAVYIIRELIGALTLLQESRGVTHGAVAPERLLITPKGRVVVADYVLGPAIERLEFTRARLWREFRVTVPPGKGHPKLDDKADVMQVGITAAALLLGRPIDYAEFPDRLDDLLAALGHVHRSGGMEPVPPALIHWVKRALYKDPAGKFANVAEARLLLESVLSKQDIASGGAAALKSVAERFGRYAADEEARAAAAAAEEARKAAITAQATAMEAIRMAASDAAFPESGTVPAFTLLSEAPAGLAPGSSSELVIEQVPLPAAETDPPVGWRVPEAPPVEDTLPVSPLLQIDPSGAATAQEEFIEEVLDLTGLASDEDVKPDAEAAALTDQSRATTAAIAYPAVGSEAAAEPGLVTEPAPVTALAFATEPELAAEPELVPEPAIADRTPSVVDEILSVLEAEPPPPPAPHGLPEWRLLADPVGASAPTIDAVEPTETLDELVAEFEATPLVPHGHDDVPSTVPEFPSFAPETTDSALIAGQEQRPVADAPQQALEEPAGPVPTTLDVVLGLQEAQAAAQAAAQPNAETAPDLSAWRFVEELVHRDERFAPPSASEAWLPAGTAEPPAGPAESPAATAESPAATAESPAAEENAPAAGWREPAPTAEPERSARVPKLPADWFVEVGRRPQLGPPIEGEIREPAPDAAVIGRARASRPEVPATAQVESVDDAVPLPPAPWTVAANRLEAAPPARPEAAARVADVIDHEPTGRRMVASDPQDDPSGPVFPRIAPSVRRVRAEARRRRWARLGSAILGGFFSIAGGLASVGQAAASGIGAVVSGIGWLATGVGRAGVSGARALVALLTGLGAGVLAAGRAALHASGTVARVAASGLVSAARAVGTGAAAAAGGVVAALAVATRASGALLASLARMAARGATALATGLVSAAASTGRAGAVGAAALARGVAATFGATAAGLGRMARASGAGLARLFVALAAGAGAVGRGSVAAGRAAARTTARVAGGVGGTLGSAGRVAGRGGAVAGEGLARAAVGAPRRIYFFFSDLADRLPRPVFRPWYLAAALVVIVAVAGVPFARSWLGTHAPDLRTTLIEPVRQPAPAEPPKGPAAGARGTGIIRVTVDPAGAEVLLDGMLQGTAPLTIENVSPGSHTLVVRDDSGTVRQGVRVSADGASDISLKIRPGWLAVFAPVKLEVLEGGKSIGSTEGGRILTAPGPHTIELVSQAIGFRETRQVEIKPGEVFALTLELPPVPVEVAAPAEAEIFVDGQSVGLSPLGPLQIAVGTREFVMRHPTLGERRQTVRVSYNGPARISFD